MSQNSENGTRPLTSKCLLKANMSMRKMHWLTQGLRKVKFRWNQVITLETSFYICIEKGKNIKLVCLLLLLNIEIKNVWHLQPFLHLETSGLPACYPLSITSDLCPINTHTHTHTHTHKTYHNHFGTLIWMIRFLFLPPLYFTRSLSFLPIFLQPRVWWG